MSLPARLKRLLQSSPATTELGAYIETIEAQGYDDTEIKEEISALETAIGDAESGLIKSVNDNTSAIGDAESGLTKSVNDNTSAIGDLEDAIGDEETADSILGRIKALEDAS